LAARYRRSGSFFFHTSRFFDPLDWHVKNAIPYEPLAITAAFFILWGMPLMFVISGSALYFALKHSMRRFVTDKVLRLLVPLVVGIFTLSIIQVYLERLTYRQFRGSLIDFIPNYFQGWYGFGGNFAWMGMHLWYLEILFLYSLLLMPLFYWLKNGSGQGALKWLGDQLARPGFVFAIAAPISLLLITFNPTAGLGMQIFGGWAALPYLLFLFAGFVIISHEGVQDRIVQYRYLSLGIGGVLTLALLVAWQQIGQPAFGTQLYTIFYAFYGVVSWCWIQAVLGFGFKYLNTPHRLLAYAGQAVLAFYILHQTVLLVVGYFVVQWRIPDLLKWGIIATVSFAAIMLLYEFAIRRVNFMRFLFGMKLLTPASVQVPPSLQKPVPAVKPGH
jgi:hypothetical protein